MRNQRVENRDFKMITRPAALSESAADAIRNAIMEGAFGLGEALPESQLTRRLGISKTPIREALSLLAREGLVHGIPQRGFFVFTLDRQDISQLCAFRYALEKLALDMALANDRSKLVSDLSDICSQMEEAHDAGDFHSYQKLDTAFHAAFFDRAENGYVTAAYQLVASKVATIRTHLSRGHQRTNLSLTEHQDILKALEDGKDIEAQDVLRKQIFRGEEVYEELIVSSSPHRPDDGRTRS